MINFLNKARENKWLETPWLIIGKGPSFELLPNFDVSQYKTISLNHIVENTPVDVAHIIDWDVFVSCQEAVDKNAGFLVMPFYPHVDNKPQQKSLAQYCEEQPLLAKLNKEGRLLWYNSSLANHLPVNEGPVIPVQFFSADAVVALLAYSGVKEIRTLGIDGGIRYSKEFAHLNDKTLLSNGQANFDLQFKAIGETLTKTGVRLMPLYTNEPIKVYVGSQRDQLLSVKVLEYSIKKNTGMSVDVFPMYESNIEIPMPVKKENQPRTPFSFQRFIIPELNGHKGRAIYLDSDMQVFTDIQNLWNQDMHDADICSTWEADGSQRRPQFSVMLMDCDKLNWDVKEIVKMLDSGALNYETLMFEMKVAEKISPSIEAEWNSLEKYEEGKTKLLHYTDMDTQPWICRNNPLSEIWTKAMCQAIDDGFITEGFLRDEIIAGYVRPSLWWQYKKKRQNIEHTKEAHYLDLYFIPPYQKLFLNKKNSFFGNIYNKLVYTLIKMAVKTPA